MGGASTTYARICLIAFYFKLFLSHLFNPTIISRITVSHYVLAIMDCHHQVCNISYLGVHKLHFPLVRSLFVMEGELAHMWELTDHLMLRGCGSSSSILEIPLVAHKRTLSLWQQVEQQPPPQLHLSSGSARLHHMFLHTWYISESPYIIGQCYSYFHMCLLKWLTLHWLLKLWCLQKHNTYRIRSIRRRSRIDAAFE